MNQEPRTLPPAAAGRRADGGFALVLALIFAILLYILVAELVVSGRMVRATGENDALLARMRNQMHYQLDEAKDQLLADMQGAAAAAESGSGGSGTGLGNALSGGAGNAGNGGAGGESGGEEQTDPSATCDSSRDSWFQPVGAADNDLTTYTWVEDENRKFNLLALWSPDQEFQKLSRERFVRLVDALREDSDYDVSSGDAQRLLTELDDWVRRSDTENLPRPMLKTETEKDKQGEIALPLHLDELLMLPSMNEALFYDFVIDGRVYLGLESVLTLWTSLQTDPGDPEKVARQRAMAEANGEQPPAAGGNSPGGNSPGGNSPGGSANGGSGNGGSGQAPGGEEAPAEPLGEGIRINVNTASRAVLRAILGPDKVPDHVIDAIIRYRNEVDEEAMKQDQEGEQKTEVSDFGDMQLGSEQKLKFFETVADLEKVEEFAQIADPQVKAEFQAALTTKSDVFSIHLATLFKRNEENRVYLLRRARAIVMRIDDGADGKIVPLVPFEERSGLRVMPVDLQEKLVDVATQYVDLDDFSKEERAWNPFLVDFYLPKAQREEFYLPGK